jgi:hypothetical protein
MAGNAGMDCSRRLGWQRQRDRSDAPGPRQWLIGVSRYRCSGSPNSTRSSPTASWQCEDLDSLTSGWQQTAVAAGDIEETQ